LGYIADSLVDQAEQQDLLSLLIMLKPNLMCGLHEEMTLQNIGMKITIQKIVHAFETFHSNMFLTHF
jgi:hypothetical protein